ncbi:MAG TPA: transglycosylase family protein [Acidimicrobiales bacterium]|nr:transglycosylase family protein [Acidimicrobiales bacterium]
MRRVMAAALVALATPLALLTAPPVTAVAAASARHVNLAPTTRHALARPRVDVVARQEVHALIHDAHVRGVGVTGLRQEWQRVALCEVNGDWSMVGPVYSGIGFLNSTWVAYGGRTYAPVAGRASRDEQIVVGMRVTGGWVPDQYGCDPGGW